MIIVDAARLPSPTTVIRRKHSTTARSRQWKLQHFKAKWNEKFALIFIGRDSRVASEANDQSIYHMQSDKFDFVSNRKNNKKSFSLLAFSVHGS